MHTLISVEPAHRDGDLAWHALYTRHQHEKSVAHILSSKEFEVFLPLYWTVHRWKDRDKQLWLPLFPCYVFLKGGLRRQLDILTTPGVHSVVSSAGRFADIPEEEINAVRQMMESGTRLEPHPFMKFGDRVRVKSGPLTGVEGILIRKKKSISLGSFSGDIREVRCHGSRCIHGRARELPKRSGSTASGAGSYSCVCLGSAFMERDVARPSGVLADNWDS